MTSNGVKHRKKTTPTENDVKLGLEDFSVAKAALQESISLQGAEKTGRDLYQALLFRQDDINSYCKGPIVCYLRIPGLTDDNF